MQHGVLCLWAIVDPEKPKIKSTIVIHGTGHPINHIEEQRRFLGTVIDRVFVWHVFVE